MTPKDIMDALAEPFEASEVKFKPQSVKGNRAMAIAFIDARLVMDRLDDVVGVDGWQDEYTPTGEDGGVICRLSLKIGGVWVSKTDVGGQSEQPDSGDRTKAAFSDALKRTAVKFGIGRYIYRLGHQWCDYDPQKRQFIQRPQLPNWALPNKQPKKPAPAPYADPDTHDTPTAAPAPAKRPTNEELSSLMRSRGWNKWPACIHAINLAESADYAESDLPDAILADHLARFCQHLRSLPEKAKANV